MKRICFLTFLFSIALSIHLSGQYEHLAVSNIDSSLLKKAYSIVRYDSTKVTLRNGKAIYDHETAITVIDKKHADKLSFTAYYEEDNSKVKDIKIKILDENGEIIKKVKNKEILDQYIFSYVLISQSRSKHFKYTPKKYPTTIVYSYTEIDKYPTKISNWAPLEDFNMSVESAIYTIYNEDELNLLYDEKNLSAYGINSSLNGKYLAKKIKPITKEKYMPARSSIFPLVKVYPTHIKYYSHETRAETWNDLGKWMYNEMFLPQQNCNKINLKKEIDLIVKNKSDKYEIAKVLYKYIQKNSRYVAIMLDDGGYVPICTNEVHEKKYGDCKALSFYYETLLSLYDIDSHLAFIYAGDSRKAIDTNFVSPTHFNHVINHIVIDGKEYWTDCTSSDNPFNYLGKFSDDREVLLSSSTKGKIHFTPKYLSQIKNTLDVTLSSDGSISGVLYKNSTGPTMDRKLHTLSIMNKKEKEIYHNSNVFNNFRNTLVQDSRLRLDTISLTLIEEFEFEAPNIFTALGNHLQMPVNIITIPIPKFQKDKNRTWDIFIERDEIYENIIKIRLPNGMKTLPDEDIKLSTPYGNYSYTTITSERTVTLHRKFELFKQTHKASQYNEMKNFFDKINNTEKRKITISSKK